MCGRTGAGAQGYVMKEDADDVLVDAIRSVLKGEVYVSAEISSRMLQQLAANPTDEKPTTGVQSLTEREMEIFDCIGHGMSTKEIAEKYTLRIYAEHPHGGSASRSHQEKTSM